MSNVAANSLVGSTLGGKYEIEALIGEGAMGSVYRAHQTSLQKSVAIKVLHHKLADQPAFVQRFQREAYSASLLDHPNSLRVLDFGESDGLLYLVMEFVQGEDLLTVMERDWPLEERRIVDVLSQALAALATAHDFGIVHRDLKPENILLLRGTDDEGKPIDSVKVCDFGIAKLLSTPSERGKSFSRRLTTEGFVVGTPDFMSPEQARGQEIDGRSDIYSMGVVLYQMLAGTLPFTADTPLGVALQHISDVPLPPSKHASKVNPHLEAICMRALSKNPEERFENAREMRRALRGALESGGVPASSVRAAPPRPHSTDMTSVPASSATPSLPRFRTGLAGYLFRRPATSRGWAVMVLAATIAFGALSFLVTLFSGRGSDRTAIATTNDTVVLASPSPPIADPMPGGAMPALAPEEPSPTLARRGDLDRVDSNSNRQRGERSGTRPNETASSKSVSAAGGSAGEGKGLVAPASASQAPLGQPSSLPSAEAIARSAASETPVRVAEPPPRAPAAPAAAPPAETAVPAAASTLDPTRASVTMGAIATTGGISQGKVRAALARVSFTSCYRRALANRSSASPMEATLRINVDVGGRVTGATLSNDGNLPGLRSCIESDARGMTIRDVDTGDGSAVVTLTFSPR